MDSINITLGLTNTILATLFLVISIPLVKGKIPMNRVYVFRIAKAFESDEKWYKINAYGGRQLMLWSLPLFLFGLATFCLPLFDINPV